MTSHLTRLTDAVGRVCLLVDNSCDREPRSAAPSVGTTGSPVMDVATSLVGSIRMLSDDQLQRLLSDAGTGRAEFDRVISIAAGE
ncbi:MAG TPA: hypothetical protein VG369_02305, partial [Humibacter sp.]|nr:hypothetical protein [Humibacter sp.]